MSGFVNRKGAICVHRGFGAAQKRRGPGKPPQIVCTLPDGSKLTGTYTYTNGKVRKSTSK